MRMCCIYLSNTRVRVSKRNPVYKYQKYKYGELGKSTILCQLILQHINQYRHLFNKYQTSNQQISVAKEIMKD